MPSARAILSELNSSRTTAKDEKEEWIRLTRQYQSALWPAYTWLGIALFSTAIVMWIWTNEAAHLRMITLAPIAFLSLTSPVLFVAHRRRHQAMIAIIAKCSPQLSRKLREEGIG